MFSLPVSRFVLVLLQVSAMACSVLASGRTGDGDLLLPTVELYENREFWEPVLNGTGLYSKNSDTLYARCVADYSVEWEFDGYVNNLNIVNMRPFVRAGVSKFQADLIIFVYEEYPLSGWITCKSVTSPDVQRKLSVFAPGERGRVFMSDELVVRDSNVLPCRSTYPFSQVEVEKANKNGPNDIVSGKYHPATGFTFAGPPSSGLYLCKDARSSARMQVKLEMSNEEESSAGFEFSPRTVHVRGFTGDNIQFVCKILLEGAQAQADMQMQVQSTNASPWYIQHEPLSKIFMLHSTKEVSGVVTCKSGQFSRRWRYEFVTPPKLYLDNHEGELDCLSDHMNKSVASVRCKNPSDCRLWSRCLQPQASTDWMCNSWKPIYVSSSRNTRCWTGQTGANCASLPYVHFNGLVQCSVAGLTRTWEYFVGLRQRRLSDWRDAEPEELLRLDPIEVQSSGKTRIFCEATSFLFANSLRIRLELKNGQFLDVTGDDGEDVDAPQHPRQMDEFNIAKEVSVELPENLKAIYCYAPWWNSTEWMNATAKFVTREPTTF